MRIRFLHRSVFMIPRKAATMASVKFRTSDEVDFLVIGSGAAGGVMAKELTTAGFRVVVLEQGPYLRERISLTTKSNSCGNVR